MEGWTAFLATLGIVGIILLIAIIVAIIVSYFLALWAVYKMAETRGRNALGWVILAFLTTPLIGMLLLACLGETEEQEEWRIYQEELIREKARKGEPF